MQRVLYLLVAVALLGAFDTFYYHEWRARLPALGSKARVELRLHAWRDFIYAALFATLPWLAWRGWFVVALGALLAMEIVLTLWDFVVEDWIRKPLGGVYPGERVMHAVIGILYGAFLTTIVPVLAAWWALPSRLAMAPAPVAAGLRWLIMMMAVVVLLSGCRDLYAVTDRPGSAWPWA